MSFPIDPSLYEYSIPPKVCPACFDLGKTPESLFLCFADIKIGATWIPADPPPPNGVWEIPVSAACQWIASVGLYDFDYRPVDIATTLRVDVTGGGLIFLDQNQPACSVWWSNEIIAPAGVKYYGGFCQVVPPLAGDSFSAADLLALLSDDPLWALWCNPKPTSTGATVYKLYNPRDRTNIHIKHQSP